MTDPSSPPADDETRAAIGYVRGLWPPLPRAYGVWLVELAHRAREGADPELELAIPDAIVESGTPLPRDARRAEDGTLVITLRQALAALRQEDLLYPDEEQPTWPPVEIVNPAVALSLANTADAAISATHDPDAVAALAAELKAGTWKVDLDNPIRVDRQGRITTGLNTLLAIVATSMEAPVSITYAYDNGPFPLTWRPPHDTTPAD